MKYLIIIIGWTLLLSCTDNTKSKIDVVSNLTLSEVSGIEFVNNTLWAHEDSGNENKIYKIAADGSVAQAIKIEGSVNTDWEDIASDAQGNLYIGNFGNNDNKRKDLCIYKLDVNQLGKVAYTINFYYPEQKEFPPKKSEFIYDVEAFFEHNGNFYLFTKNRSKGFDGSVNVYKVPNKAGNHAAQRMGTIQTCGKYRSCAITAADISADGTKAVLLSGEKVWLITDFGDGDFASGTVQELDLGHYSQKEGICFKDNDTLLIADEKDGKTGKKLYSTTLTRLQAKE